MNKDLNILALTLARGGSKSIKNKNIVEVDGVPLIAYTIREAKKSNLIDEYIVSTDCERIKEVALSYGANVPFMRPEELSNDTAKSSDALIHAVIEAERINNCQYDYIIELMATCPLKTREDIDAIIELMVMNKHDSVIAVHKLDDHHPARIKKIENGKLVDFCVEEKLESRRQDLKPDAYIRSGAIYGMSRSFLVDESKRFESNRSVAYIMDQNKAVNIDGPLDLMLFKAIIE